MESWDELARRRILGKDMTRTHTTTRRQTCANVTQQEAMQSQLELIQNQTCANVTQQEAMQSQLELIQNLSSLLQQRPTRTEQHQSRRSEQSQQDTDRYSEERAEVVDPVHSTANVIFFTELE